MRRWICAAVALSPQKQNDYAAPLRVSVQGVANPSHGLSSPRAGLSQSAEADRLPATRKEAMTGTRSLERRLGVERPFGVVDWLPGPRGSANHREGAPSPGAADTKRPVRSAFDRNTKISQS
jgi:hypothetical protein